MSFLLLPVAETLAETQGKSFIILFQFLMDSTSDAE